METSLFGEGIGDVTFRDVIGIAKSTDDIVPIISLLKASPLGDFNTTLIVKSVDNRGDILFIVIVFCVLEQERSVIIYSTLSCIYLT